MQNELDGKVKMARMALNEGCGEAEIKFGMEHVEAMLIIQYTGEYANYPQGCSCLERELEFTKQSVVSPYIEKPGQLCLNF